MNNWITVITFTYPHEAHLVKGFLESNGIETQITDELTAQVNNFYSNAIGGVKINVHESDFEIAYRFLVESGYIIESETAENPLLERVLNWSAKLPFIGKAKLGYRMLSLVGLFSILIAIPVFVLIIPSKRERLTENLWCVKRIEYQGTELIVSPNNLIQIGNSGNCNTILNFSKDGIVTLPSVEIFPYRASWRLEKDSIFITDKKGKIDAEYQVSDKEIYNRAYALHIKDNSLTLKSEDLEISAYSVNNSVFF